MNFKKPSKDLEWKILTEEVDEATGDELPEKETLNEELFEGDTAGADLVKRIYREAKYIKFRYDREGVCGTIQMTVGISLILLPLIGVTFILFPIIKAPWPAYLMCCIGITFLSLLLTYMWKSSFAVYYDGHFFKRGNKTITFYLPRGGKDRGLIVYFNQNKIFQLQNGEFISITDTTKRSFMGNRLMFNYMYGYMKLKRKKNKMFLKTENSDRSCFIVIKPENKITISTTRTWIPSTLQTLYIDEYNSGNDVLELPESFKALCEQVGVKPLENEHIKYI